MKARSVQTAGINYQRRNFLKFVGVGAIGYLASRLLSQKSEPIKVGEVGGYRNFKVRERGGSLQFFNSRGIKLFQLHQDGELEIG